MTASLLFLGLNPLFVSPRNDTIAIARRKSQDKSKQTLKKRKKKYIERNKKQSNNLPAAAKANVIATNCNIPPVNDRKYSSETSVSASMSDEILSVASRSDNNHNQNNINIVNDIQNEMMYLILTKQRNEATQKVKELESELLQNDVEFALKYVEFKKQLKDYKKTNNCLQIENEKLKNDVQKLKKKLILFNENNNFDSLLKKRRKYQQQQQQQQQQQLPNFCSKDYQKKMKTQMDTKIKKMNILKSKNTKKPNKQNKQQRMPFIVANHANKPSNSSSSSSSSSSSASSSVTVPSLTHIRHLTTILEDNIDIIASEESISYMSNNTMLLDDLQFPLDMQSDIAPIHDHNMSNLSIASLNEMCDESVKSPVELGADYCFNVRINV